MASPRLAAFAEELRQAMKEQQPRAEQLILRVPGEGHAALDAASEAELLMAIGGSLGEPVNAWVQAVQALATTERAWGPSEGARRHAQEFAA
ncbi:MAG: hypothetical protein LC624_05275, partial [Halobacteriales archaeon]|nr:hypothetical protein [Halobacteriales archaeon]